MPETDLSLLIDAARQAGDIARSYHGRDGLDVRTKPEDQSPVSEADLAVNAALEARLRAARPDYGWLSEESADDPARQSRDRVFIVDPIDGTRSFVEGQTTWAHSIAIAEQGKVIAGVVFLPLRDKMYTATAGDGARLNGAPIGVSTPNALEGAEVLATKPNFDARHWRGAVPDLKRSHRPSLAYRLSLVAEGRFDAMFTFRPSWEWDIAAGSLILAEAGARVTDRRGAPLRFNNPHPQTDGVLGAAPRLHAELLERLA